METSNKSINRLSKEKSPYLLQHAHNPVDWYPWGEEAFEKAKREDKPIFLSIGYSTCHWCHVMAHESFEDEEVAKFMNETFISIKVDREERPDIDNIYMTVCQMITGSGGWPLSLILTPEKKPFFAGTYIPKKSRYGRMGMIELISKVQQSWKSDRKKLISSADYITERVRENVNDEQGEDLGEEVLRKGFKQLEAMFDGTYGGFGSAPKFPTPHNLMFLLRYYARTSDGKALHMVEKTLSFMSLGGIYDHIGYGFHRYSTDRKWLLPHFEKMLYDQALLSAAYTEAYQITKNKNYKQLTEDVFEYIIRDMMAETGAFYSGEDADSEGEEGKFYVWSVEELKNTLDKRELEIIVQHFNLSEKGNFKDEATGQPSGLNIFHLTEMPKENTEEIERIRQKLFQYREKRVHPHKDDKVLTDWNGLMIYALAKAASVLNNERYSIIARRTADFFIESIKTNKMLMHRFCKGEWKVTGNIDDYSFVIFGLLELYEATTEIKYLKEAIKLNDVLIQHFWDKEAGGFYFTSTYEEEVLFKTKEIYDGAIPSGNSICYLNLQKLSRITGDLKYEEYAEKLQKVFSSAVKQSPASYCQFLNAVDFSLSNNYEVVLVGRNETGEIKKMTDALRKSFNPGMTIVFKNESEAKPEIEKIAAYTKDQKSIDGLATAYICKNYICSSPTTNLKEMIARISGSN